MAFDLSTHEKSNPKMVENLSVGPGETQELKRGFSLISLLALSVSLMATWEPFAGISKCSILFLLIPKQSSTMVSGLISGGPVSLLYGFIGTITSAQKKKKKGVVHLQLINRSFFHRLRG